jgi:hypothetical protein
MSIGEEEETGRTRSHVTLRVLPTYYWVAKFDLATDRPSTSSILLAFTTAHDCGHASSESQLIWSSRATTASTAPSLLGARLNGGKKCSYCVVTITAAFCATRDTLLYYWSTRIAWSWEVLTFMGCHINWEFGWDLLSFSAHSADGDMRVLSRSTCTVLCK